jgi:energy-coupling factor transport system substrate-specific component
LNIVGGQINTALHLPTFLDMIGTGVVAIVLGPWWGALVGALTNLIGSSFPAQSTCPSLCAISSAPWSGVTV